MPAKIYEAELAAAIQDAISLSVADVLPRKPRGYFTISEYCAHSNVKLTRRGIVERLDKQVSLGKLVRARAFCTDSMGRTRPLVVYGAPEPGVRGPKKKKKVG